MGAKARHDPPPPLCRSVNGDSELRVPEDPFEAVDALEAACDQLKLLVAQAESVVTGPLFYRSWGGGVRGACSGGGGSGTHRPLLLTDPPPPKPSPRRHKRPQSTKAFHTKYGALDTGATWS